ncbi:hypothetical protein JP75_20810 [Devosia riboflavina]|uniref:Uncharacterized protein n=1 Tax=Devosia riboflavina TaxID=46914 RepID=A0A087LY09_9HYPH|nr:hypothetical protein [Devosia riboflavina]KFL29512.1 hypothetical protein JP75_20810 [Devosia riboflavina]
MSTYIQQLEEARSREQEIARLRNVLKGLHSVPEHRRQAECADERMLDVVAALRSLGDDCRDVRIIEIIPGRQ